MRDWSAAGFDPDAFWRQSPASFAAAMEGAALRAKFAAERDVALAHTTAVFSRLKKLEPLERYLPPRAPEPQPAGSMLEKMKRIVAQTGGVWCEDEPEA